ncbi:MAG: SDR family oxidoreductase, partial [Planctomycetes bacterium]|nr:SDR family oxidoreductase [Planctomycetota bacterium]
MELDRKIALVTGAARHVGKAIALGLARCGADIALHYHSSNDAEKAAAKMKALGRRVELFRADLARPNEIEAMFDRIGEVFGRLDVLVNSAGICHRTPIETLSAEQWDTEFAVNARAPALCIRHAISLMTDGGAIVNITDIGAEKAWGGLAAYCASKAAL